jgi:hypothetical protein
VHRDGRMTVFVQRPNGTRGTVTTDAEAAALIREQAARIRTLEGVIRVLEGRAETAEEAAA